MNMPESLNPAFKTAQPELNNYVIALKSENLKLHQQISRLQVQNVTKQNRILSLEKELEQLSKKNGVSLHIDLGNSNTTRPALTGLQATCRQEQQRPADAWSLAAARMMG